MSSRIKNRRCAATERPLLVRGETISCKQKRREKLQNFFVVFRVWCEHLPNFFTLCYQKTEHLPKQRTNMCKRILKSQRHSDERRITLPTRLKRTPTCSAAAQSKIEEPSSSHRAAKTLKLHVSLDFSNIPRPVSNKNSARALRARAVFLLNH